MNDTQRMNYIFTHYDNNVNSVGIRCFLNSIQKLNSDNIIVFFFTNVTVPESWDNYKFLRVVHTSCCSAVDLRPQVNRWFHFRNFLEKNITLFNNEDKFFALDCGDSIIQKNPFEEIHIRDHILFALESEKFTLKQGFNKRCILQLLNKEFRDPEIQKFIYNPIICTGTVYFDTLSLFIDWLSFFTKHTVLYLANNTKFHHEKFKLGMCNDQGITNTLINTKPIPFLYKLIKNEELTIIATVALMMFDGLDHSFSTKGDIITIDEKTPCIVHQYNRNTDLTSSINNIYGR